MKAQADRKIGLILIALSEPTAVRTVKALAAAEGVQVVLEGSHGLAAAHGEPLRERERLVVILDRIQDTVQKNITLRDKP